MHARLHDRMGPLLPRAILPAAGAAIACAALTAALFVPAEIAIAIACGGGVLAHWGWLLPIRHRPKHVELVLGPGWVDVRKAGAANQRIGARDVVGASTARSGDKVSLALTRKSRRFTSTVLELDSDDDAKRARDALGIGHDGFGDVVWPIDRPAIDTLTVGAGVLGLIAFAFGAFALGIARGEPVQMMGWIYGVSMGLIATLAVVLLRTRSIERPPCIALRADGAHVYGARGWMLLPYARITDVEVAERGFVIRFRQGYRPVIVPAPLVSDEARHHVAAQLLAAAARANGARIPKPEVRTRVDLLSRGEDPPRAWLSRLDVAASTLSQTSGYRASVLDQNDLWQTLEDPDADGTLRAAAARVLVRADPAARVRIDGIVAAVRSDADAQRIRIVTEPDLDLASSALEAIEGERKKA